MRYSLCLCRKVSVREACHEAGKLILCLFMCCRPPGEFAASGDADSASSRCGTVVAFSAAHFQDLLTVLRSADMELKLKQVCMHTLPSESLGLLVLQHAMRTDSMVQCMQ